ncbi:hypothetical protein [Pelagibius sp. 7325]|uniref:hypothetical protein n=1 Tax=Pelagibius sp. 7325 TaxID=3131994 RepID=UPI0030EBE4CB
MQIGSGPSALSPSLLKALGAQGGAHNAAPSGAAATPGDPRATAAARTGTFQATAPQASAKAAPSASPNASGPDLSAATQPVAAVGGGPLPPRGSFVDLRA